MQTYSHPGLKTLEGFCRDHNISRSTAYREIARQRLRVVKVGAATRIKPEDEISWLASLPEIGAAA